jgi:hypothetical protein
VLARWAIVAAATVAVAASVGASAPGVNPSRVPALKRVVVVVFENRSYGQVIGKPWAPTFNRLARRYALLTRYFAVTRPSLPNYLALVSGSTQGVTETCNECAFSGDSLADTIEASGRTWKTYAEGLPAPGFTGAASGRYVKRHNPLLYFTKVLADPARLARIVPFTELARDLSRRRLPDFSLVIPDLCNGMHDCSIARGDAWLDRFLKPLLASSQLAGGAVFVTFDEASGKDATGGRVPTLVLGPKVRPGARSTASLTHYSLLRTIEDGWRLPHLGNAATAVPIRGIWRS